jgi:uncharacterized membrane protein YphA (DoxX/SURF4 family)
MITEAGGRKGVMMDRRTKLTGTIGFQDAAWTLLRVYLGLALFVKGLVFLADLSHVRTVMAAADFRYPSLAQPIALTHMAGGILLAFGLWTRFAAAIQVPILAGAVLFVHLQAGLFTEAQTLEFALLVLVLLTLFVLGGAGPVSADAAAEERAPLQGEHARETGIVAFLRRANEVD